MERDGGNMSILKNILSGSSVTNSIFGGSTSSGSSGGSFSRVIESIKIEENPNKPIRDLQNKLVKEHRKDIEEKAESIHSSLGKVVRTAYNMGDTAENAQDSLNNGIIRSLFSQEVKNLKIGDHLFVQRIGYTHHGLYVGGEKVVHYLLESVKEDSLENFADGAKIQRKLDEESPISYSRNIVVERAYRRLRENKYNLIINNCESFVRWCRNGTDKY
jgi:hypothetical protein